MLHQLSNNACDAVTAMEGRRPHLRLQQQPERGEQAAPLLKVDAGTGGSRHLARLLANDRARGGQVAAARACAYVPLNAPQQNMQRTPQVHPGKCLGKSPPRSPPRQTKQQQT